MPIEGETPKDELRKAVFLALVEAQDKGAGVVKSRRAVAKQFDISVDQVSKIEKEGLEKEWPPL
jgi:DNA invertase Pin-like site-specific DNA recombinase